MGSLFFSVILGFCFSLDQKPISAYKNGYKAYRFITNDIVIEMIYGKKVHFGTVTDKNTGKTFSTDFDSLSESGKFYGILKRDYIC